jgi:hypothetical protein
MTESELGSEEQSSDRDSETEENFGDEDVAGITEGLEVMLKWANAAPENRVAIRAAIEELEKSHVEH